MRLTSAATISQSSALRCWSEVSTSRHLFVRVQCDVVLVRFITDAELQTGEKRSVSSRRPGSIQLTDEQDSDGAQITTRRFRLAVLTSNRGLSAASEKEPAQAERIKRSCARRRARLRVPHVLLQMQGYKKCYPNVSSIASLSNAGSTWARAQEHKRSWTLFGFLDAIQDSMYS
ncbi:hypothetical protein KC325_g51 [Hortaea werneckii]|nr:hypothetical protein KC325_g51 [Hortaea werneckii]